jgi:hypothetical protein
VDDITHQFVWFTDPSSIPDRSLSLVWREDSPPINLVPRILVLRHGSTSSPYIQKRGSEKSTSRKHFYANDRGYARNPIRMRRLQGLSPPGPVELSKKLDLGYSPLSHRAQERRQ